MTYPSTRQLNFSYDSIGRPSAVSGYLSNIGYNIAGQVTGDTLGNGVTEQFGYDANRLQLTSQKAGTVSPYTDRMDLTYSYNAAAGQMGAGTTAGNPGQLMSVSGTIGGTTESAAYTYDNVGRLVTSNQTSNGSSAQRRFDYDRFGNRTGVWDATSGGNQIQSVTLEQSGGAPTDRIQTLYPPRTNFALSANGSTASSSSNFSSAYVPSAVINGDRKGTGWGEVGGGWMDNTSSTYPDWVQVTFNGNKTIDEIDVFTLQDNYSNPSEPTESMTFSQYGIVDFQIQYWNGLGWQTVSGGSITGNNKVWKKVNFSQITTTKIRVNVTNALNNYSRVTELEAWGPGVGINYSYDAAGNVTNDGVHTYQYDSENRLVSVDSGATASYAYDHQNRRYMKTVGSSVTHYVWEGAQVLAEHDGSSGAVLTDYVYSGNRMIAKVASGSRQYFLSDRLSARLVLDTSGNVLGRQGHLPFGGDFGESGTQEKHHFTSYERDGESGTDYAVNREYGQSLGRFMRVDPLTGSRRNPQTLNRYAYVLNNPVNRVDPLGLDDGDDPTPPPPPPPPPYFWWLDTYFEFQNPYLPPFIQIRVDLQLPTPSDNWIKVAEAFNKAAELLQKKDCKTFMQNLMQTASKDNRNPTPVGGPMSPVFDLPPSPSYALNLYGQALAPDSEIIRFSGASGTVHNPDGTTTITYGEPTWRGFDVALVWNKEFFELGTTAAAQHTLHESLHLIPGFDDVLLADTAAKLAGSDRRFTTTTEASRYLNEQIQSHCH